MKKLFLTSVMFSVVGLFCGCNDDNDGFTPEVIETTTGMFIVNEGNYYSSIDGALSYIDYTTDIVTVDAFKKANGISLGGTPNDGIIYKDHIYIPATDENLLWVLDAHTLKVTDRITITQPRKIVAGDGFVFVTSYAGKVTSVNVSNGEMKTSEALGKNPNVTTYLEDITYLNGYLYVCNAYNPDYSYNDNVIKMTTDLKKVKDITVVCNPTQIETDGKDVYVQSTGNYADVGTAIQKIDENDKVTTLCEGTNFALGNGKMYYYATSYDENWQSVITYNVYDLKTGKTSQFIDGSDIEYPNSMGFDPWTGYVYVSAYHLSEYGYGDYNSPGYIVRYDAEGKKLKSFDVGVGPKTMIFQSNLQ